MSDGDGMDSLLECIVLGHVGSYYYVPSCTVLRNDATRDPQ
jgi:hypothetical protein